MLTWILIAAGLFLGFLLMLGLSIYRKKKSLAIFSLLPLGFSVIAGCIALYFILSATYQTVSGKMDKATKQRPGEEIYTQLFGNGSAHCTSILNSKDALIPIIDCCIWLEFSTCPQEIDRLIAQKNYRFTKLNKETVSFVEPGIAEKPNWFAPATLGDSALVYKASNSNGKGEYLLFLKTDSTRAFYCELNR